MSEAEPQPLSLRARGLLALFTEVGRVIPASEAVHHVREGRDAVRAVYNELEQADYIQLHRFQTASGRWATEYRFSRAWFTDAGFSGDLSGETAVELEATSYKLVTIIPNGIMATSSGDPKEPTHETEEYVEMAWPGFDDEPKAKTDDAVGAVGKLPEDKRELRQAKYKKTKIEAVPEHMRRGERPESEWTTPDLCAEFYDLTRKAAPGVPAQVNGKSLASWINQRVGDGTPRPALLKAIRMFFNDPRLIRDPGVGQPLWRRFIAYYPTVHGTVVKTEMTEYADESFLGHQDKMMRILEG